jgi:hypothetical protein
VRIVAECNVAQIALDPFAESVAAYTHLRDLRLDSWVDGYSDATIVHFLDVVASGPASTARRLRYLQLPHTAFDMFVGVGVDGFGSDGPNEEIFCKCLRGKCRSCMCHTARVRCGPRCHRASAAHGRAAAPRGAALLAVGLLLPEGCFARGAASLAGSLADAPRDNRECKNLAGSAMELAWQLEEAKKTSGADAIDTDSGVGAFLWFGRRRDGARGAFGPYRSGHVMVIPASASASAQPTPSPSPSSSSSSSSSSSITSREKETKTSGRVTDAGLHVHATLPSGFVGHRAPVRIALPALARIVGRACIVAFGNSLASDSPPPEIPVDKGGGGGGGGDDDAEYKCAYARDDCRSSSPSHLPDFVRPDDEPSSLASPTTRTVCYCAARPGAWWPGIVGKLDYERPSKSVDAHGCLVTAPLHPLPSRRAPTCSPDDLLRHGLGKN